MNKCNVFHMVPLVVFFKKKKKIHIEQRCLFSVKNVLKSVHYYVHLVFIHDFITGGWDIYYFICME